MKKHSTQAYLVFPLLASLFLASCKEEFVDKPFYDTNNETISEYIESKKDTFSLFQSLLQVGELEGTLAAYNPFGSGYTLFLPTNEAVNQFVIDNQNYNSLQDLLDDKEFVKSLVRFHVANIALNANDFPFGVLPDTTLSGDLLTVGFSGNLDSLTQVVNNYAPIITPNIFLTNGYIHIIDQVLKPIVFNSYEWLKNSNDYKIFVEALERTELKDTFNLINDLGESIVVPSTLLVESDDVFNQQGISSVDDLILRYSPDNTNYTDRTNGLYQFIAYHILEGNKFLNHFEGVNTNYNTYADLPVVINGSGLDIKINSGVQIFDSIITGTDTTIIDFITIKYDKSNVLTKNGAIHFIDYVMELFKPKPQRRVFQFLEEPLLYEAEKSPNLYEFNDPNLFEVITWEGIEEIQYVKSGSDLPGVMNNDYLELVGDFSIVYEIPKILPGNYMLRFRANADNYNNAFIQLFIDDERIGENIDLTSNPGSETFYTFNIGQISLINYERHLLKVKTLIPGRLEWDGVIFEPIVSN